MFAKQTIASASLLVVLVGGGIASADPATGTFEVGAGYSTDDGFLADARVAQSNLFGTGDLLSLDASLSERRQRFTLRFADPRWFDLRLYDDRRVLPGLTRDATGGVADLTHEVAPHLRIFAGFRLESVLATDTLRSREPPDRYLLAALRAGIAYDTDRSSLGLTLEHADPRLGSSLELWRVSGHANTAQPLGPLTLDLAFAFSAVSPDAPLSEHLWLDGSSDIRGYAPGALGPGTYKLTGRAELEAPLVRRLGISVGAFVDEGVIGSAHGAALGRSFGLELIWRSPIGTLHFDWAWVPGLHGPQFGFSL